MKGTSVVIFAAGFACAATIWACRSRDASTLAASAGPRADGLSSLLFPKVYAQGAGSGSILDQIQGSWECVVASSALQKSSVSPSSFYSGMAGTLNNLKVVPGSLTLAFDPQGNLTACYVKQSAQTNPINTPSPVVPPPAN